MGVPFEMFSERELGIVLEITEVLDWNCFDSRVLQLGRDVGAATRTGERADELANPGAVNVGYVAEGEENFFVSLGGKFLHGIAQNDTAFAECDTPTEIDDGDTVYLT